MRKKVHAVQHSFVDTRTGMASTQPRFQHYEEAMSRPDADMWKAACAEEMLAFTKAELYDC